MSTETLLWDLTATETVPIPPVPPADLCAACGGTGVVAPDAFGDWVAWQRWVADVEAYEREHGMDPATCGSAIRSGLVRPMACPVCGGGVACSIP